MQIPTAPIAAGSLIGGYVLVRGTGRRMLGGAVLMPTGAYLTRRWAGERGAPSAVALLGVYVASLAGSHPLAKRIGAWPAVLSAAAASAAASALVADRHCGDAKG